MSPASHESNAKKGCLLTAFEPFGGATVNASLEAARLLAAEEPTITLAVLPVVRGEAERLALAAFQRLLDTGTPPALVLSIGESARPNVSLETVAVNRDDFPIPDNAGNQPHGECIVASGPGGYAATLPFGEITVRLQGATPVPVVVSDNAGTFLCNHLAYCLSHALAGTGVRFGFVHVPAVRPGDSLTVEAIAETIRTLWSLLRVRLR